MSFKSILRFQKHSLLHAEIRIHVSWLIALFCSFTIVGAALSLINSSFVGTEWPIVSFCLGTIALINKKYLAVICVIIAGLLLGAWRGSNEIATQVYYDKYFNKEVMVSGRVTEDPSYDIDGDLRFRLKNVVIDNQQVGGEIWIATSQKVDIKRSDIVTAEGGLGIGFGNIPAAMYKARIVSIERQDFSDIGRDTRDWYAEGVREAVKEPEASLGTGFLLGQKTSLPEKLDNELRLLGLTHVVVASGYNLTILIRFARRFAFRISRFTAVAFSGGLVYGFAQITGFSPSMTRASLIAGISLITWYYGRKIHPLVLIPFSASITVIINPSYVWGDIGWLLSFMSFVGVIMMSPLINAYFWGEKEPGNIRQVVIETLSAQLLTLPMVIYVFGQYSPLALLANLLVLPLIPLAMVLTAVAGLGGLVLKPIASIVGWPAEILLGYMTGVVDYLGKWPLEPALKLSSVLRR